MGGTIEWKNTPYYCLDKFGRKNSEMNEKSLEKKKILDFDSKTFCFSECFAQTKSQKKRPTKGQLAKKAIVEGHPGPSIFNQNKPQILKVTFPCVSKAVYSQSIVPQRGEAL